MLEKAEMISMNCQKPSATVGGTIKRTRNGTYSGTTNGTIICIVNWEIYQYSDTNNETENGTRNDTTERTLNGTHNRKHIRESNKEKAKRNNKSLRSDCPSDIPERGTDAFRNQSHLLLQADQGTADDIPARYRDQFNTFADYWGYRNQ